MPESMTTEEFKWKNPSQVVAESMTSEKSLACFIHVVRRIIFQNALPV